MASDFGNVSTIPKGIRGRVVKGIKKIPHQT